MYCTKCKKHFPALIRFDDEIGEEFYDLTPCCNTEEYEESNDQKEVEVFCNKNYKPVSLFDYGEYVKKEEEREQRENAAIDAYQSNYHTLGKTAAESIFFKELNKQK